MFNVQKKSFATLDQEERIIAYLDLLGFSTFIRNMSVNQEKELRKRLNDLTTMSSSGDTRNISGACKNIIISNGKILDSIPMVVMSDSILMSLPCTHPQALYTISLKAMQLQKSMLEDFGFLIRGVILKGKLYHSNTNNGYPLVYGNGLLDAIEMEKKEKHPRIVASSDFNKIIEENFLLKKIFLCDEDKIFFINYLPQQENGFEIYAKSYIENTKKITHKESKKVKWFIKYYNKHVEYWNPRSLKLTLYKNRLSLKEKNWNFVEILKKKLKCEIIKLENKILGVFKKIC